MTNTRRKSLISTWSYKAVNGQKGPLVTMKLGSIGMSTSHWYAVVALWFAPGAEEGHGTAQRARTYVQYGVKVGFYPRDTRLQ